MLMCFQPGIGLQGNDPDSQVQNIFFKNDQFICPEHIVEKGAFPVATKPRNEVNEQNDIDKGE